MPVDKVGGSPHLQENKSCIDSTWTKVGLVALGLLLGGGAVACYLLQINAIATYSLVGASGLLILGTAITSLFRRNHQPKNPLNSGSTPTAAPIESIKTQRASRSKSAKNPIQAKISASFLPTPKNLFINYAREPKIDLARFKDSNNNPIQIPLDTSFPVSCNIPISLLKTELEDFYVFSHDRKNYPFPGFVLPSTLLETMTEEGKIYFYYKDVFIELTFDQSLSELHQYINWQGLSAPRWREFESLTDTSLIINNRGLMQAKVWKNNEPQPSSSGIATLQKELEEEQQLHGAYESVSLASMWWGHEKENIFGFKCFFYSRIDPSYITMIETSNLFFILIRHNPIAKKEITEKRNKANIIYESPGFKDREYPYGKYVEIPPAAYIPSDYEKEGHIQGSVQSVEFSNHYLLTIKFKKFTSLGASTSAGTSDVDPLPSHASLPSPLVESSASTSETAISDK